MYLISYQFLHINRNTNFFVMLNKYINISNVYNKSKNKITIIIIVNEIYMVTLVYVHYSL